MVGHSFFNRINMVLVNDRAGHGFRRLVFFIQSWLNARSDFFCSVGPFLEYDSKHHCYRHVGYTNTASCYAPSIASKTTWETAPVRNTTLPIASARGKNAFQCGSLVSAQEKITMKMRAINENENPMSDAVASFTRFPRLSRVLFIKLSRPKRSIPKRLHQHWVAFMGFPTDSWVALFHKFPLGNSKVSLYLHLI